MKAKLLAAVAGAFVLIVSLPVGAEAAGGGQQCGGFAGPQCGAGQFCQHKPGQCYTIDTSGTCSVMPKRCPQITGPKLVVCGCNGQTYPNDCQRQQAGVSLAHKGACP